MRTRFLDLFHAVSFAVLLIAAAAFCVVAVVDVAASGHSSHVQTDLLIFFTLAALPCFLLTPASKRRQDN